MTTGFDIVQVVDGGPGGALTVARGIALLPARSQHLVLTGRHIHEAPPPREGELVIGSKRRLLAHLVGRLRSLAADRVLIAHRDWRTCRAAGILTRTPVVFVSHGRGSMVASRRKRLAHGLAYRGQSFVTVSRDAETMLRRTLGIDSVVIENGVPIGSFAPPPPGEPLRLLFLGRFEGSQKRPDVPVRVAAALQRSGVAVQTTMLGDGPLGDDLRRLARDQGVEDTVEFPGWVADPRPYLQSAHLVLHATRWEGNPLGVLEALASGRPVAVSRAPGTEFLEGVPGIALVDDGEDAEEAAAAFARAVLELRERVLAQHAEAYFRSIHDGARDRFSLEGMLTRWEQFVSKL